MPSTGRSTGTSHLVRRLIRIERRCAGDPFAGVRGEPAAGPADLPLPDRLVDGKHARPSASVL